MCLVDCRTRKIQAKSRSWPGPCSGAMHGPTDTSFPPVRSSGRRPTRTKALESSGRGGPRCARRYFEVRAPSSGGIGKRGGTPHLLYAARYPALIRWRWIDDFLLKSEFSLGFMRTYKTYLSAKQEQDGHLFLPYDSGICGC